MLSSRFFISGRHRATNCLRPSVLKGRFYSLGVDTTVESNVPSETNRISKTLEKFWEKVTVNEESNGYTIRLDGKPIKTPDGHQLLVPSRKPVLAHLIAQEWSVLPELKMKNYQLPLTSLSARAVDLSRMDYESERETIFSRLLPYLDTDTLLIFSPRKDCEGTLRIAQEEQYRPYIKEAEEFWGGITLSSLDTDIMLYGNHQSKEAQEKVLHWLRSLDPWKMVGIERSTMTSKSLITAMNLIREKISVNDAANLINLEVIHQAQQWGEVEDTHDVEYHDLRRVLGSAYIVAHDNI